MKVLALVLSCVLAVQARSTALTQVSPSGELANLGENPWVVHVRRAVSTSGFLQSCAGSLIHQSWVLTTSTCVNDARFVWIRYGVVNVPNPELVTESSAVRQHPSADIGLISINRIITMTANIAPVQLEGSNDLVPANGRFCTFGAQEDNSPGEELRCYDGEINMAAPDVVVVESVATFTPHDAGSALVTDNRQTGIYSYDINGNGAFLRPAVYHPWIFQQTGINFDSSA